MLPFAVDIYPLAVLANDAVILGAASDNISGSATPCSPGSSPTNTLMAFSTLERTVRCSLSPSLPPSLFLLYLFSLFLPLSHPLPLPLSLSLSRSPSPSLSPSLPLSLSLSLSHESPFMSTNTTDPFSVLALY